MPEMSRANNAAEGPVQAPAAGQTLTIPAESGQTIVLDFDPTAVQVAAVGGNLIMAFPNGVSIRVEGFADGVPPPQFVDGNGSVLPGDALAAMLSGDGPNPIETAAGPQGTSSDGGGSVYDDDLGQVEASGLRALGVLFEDATSFAPLAPLAPPPSDDGGLFSSLTRLVGSLVGAPASLVLANPATVSVTDASSPLGGDNNATEGSAGDGTLAFRISLSHVNDGATPIKVFFALGGTATEGADYGLPGTVTDEGGGQYSVAILPGETSVDVVLTATGDSPLLEIVESVTLTVTGSDTLGVSVATAADGSLDGNPATGTGTITDSDAVFGGAGHDHLYGGVDGDLIYGGGGNDVLVGRGGADILLGGLGNDRIYGGDDNDTLYGGAGRDRLYGQNGDDQLFGDAGNDYLVGGRGNDLLDGGTGNDRLYGQNGDDTLNGGAGYDRLVAGNGNDILNGGTGNDRLYGQNGDDQLFGDAGNDYLVGGRGNDLLDGGAGNDRLYGQNGDDTLNGGAGYDRLVGGNGDDVLNGGDGIDWLYGQNGDDTLNGGDGIDILFGGGGDDTLDGGAGFGYLLGGSGDDTIIGGGNTDWMFGQNGDDVLNGGAGNDYLNGGRGDDTLLGGAGNDTLLGGSGADIFTFDFAGGQGGAGDDVVRDFHIGQGDSLRFTSVLDVNLDGADINDLVQAVAGVADDGSNVVVSFVDGGSLTLQGLGTGAITSVNDLLNELGPTGAEVV